MEQKLLQSPQMIQAMQVLQLTSPELLEKIQEELLDNPFLEEETEAPKSEEKIADHEEAQSSADDEPDLESVVEMDHILESGMGGSRSTTSDGDGFDTLSLISAAPTHAGLDTILTELRVADCDEALLHDAEVILSLLDLRGYLEGGTPEISATTGILESQLQSALDAIRQVAHPALGAACIREAYLLQIDRLPEPHPLAAALVQDQYDNLLANRLPQIASALVCELDDVREAIELLAQLDSRPLSEYDEEPTSVILPDILVQESTSSRHSGYEVILLREGVPDVKFLSESAVKALEQAKGDEKLHKFLMGKVERARWFLDAIQQRRNTLRKVSEELVRRQREFLDYGLEHLKPLKMQEVASAVGVHLSTVSRAIRGKYAQTPQGILPLKGFFSGGQSTTRGGNRSRVAIQERIREIVNAEDRSHPYSDEEIVRILKERDGVKVARRTVTKYRKMLNIPASTLRRSY